MSREPVLLFETVHGSQAYGLAREGSDVDVKGIIVGPPSWYFGFRESPEQLQISDDHVRFEIRKFFRLAAKANPTIIEVLFTDSAFHRALTPQGERLLAARDQFLSRQVERTFAKYAMAQLKRIRGHRGWLLMPPSGPPDRADFDSVKAFKTANQHHTQYQRWKENRSPERAALEARFGYDTKHAQHLVRLLRMALEITRTGKVIVHRPDRDELLAIRDGAWSYDELIDRSEALLGELERVAGSSVLPNAPDLEALDTLCASIIGSVLDS